MISFGTIVPRFLSGTVKGERLFVWWIQSEDALAIPNSFYRVVLEALLLDRFICDLDRQMHRDHDHSLAITNEDVAEYGPTDPEGRAAMMDDLHEALGPP